MLSLDNIALKYGTDKSSKAHNYTKYYEMYFSNTKEKIKNILEIGVFLAKSLYMWRDYFSSANVFGIDENINCKKFEEDRIKIFIGNQTDVYFLQSLKDIISQCDIIIDDGGHFMSQQKISFETIFPMMKTDSYYVIEDLCTSYWPQFQDSKPFMVDIIKEKIDDLNMHGYGSHKSIEREHCIKNKGQGCNYFEKTIDSIFLSKSLCIIHKIEY